MSADTLFSIANASVLPGWALLIFLPKWRWGPRLVAGVVIPGLLGVLYVFLFLTHLGDSEGGGFGSLDQISAFFAVPELLLVGWVHYLAFDLFIGAWEVRDAQRSGVHHLLVIPCLVLTFLAGPGGLLLYLVIRSVKLRRLDLAEREPLGSPTSAAAVVTFLRELYRRDRWLSLGAWLNLGLALFALLGLTLDERLVTGVNAWLKPFKFSISVAIYLGTMAWFIEYLGNRLDCGQGRAIRRLAGRLGRCVPSELLDIVLLNTAPVLLRQRVLRDGMLLFQRSDEDRVRFATRTIQEYQDSDVRRRWLTERRIQRLKRGVSDGGPRDLLAQARQVDRLLRKARGDA
jgi:hypothetical protein